MALSADPRRLRDALVFAALGLVPAALLTVLGLRAIAHADAAVRREVAQLLDATASRTEAAIGSGLERAAEELAAFDPSALADSEATTSGIVAARVATPPGAEFVAFGFQRTPPVDPSSAARARTSGADADASASYPECLALGRAIGTGGDAKTFAARCAGVRDGSGRWVFALFALAPPEGALAPELADWLDAHGTDVSALERASLAADARALADPEQRALALAALARPDVRAGSPEARRAAQPGARGWPDARGLVSWREGGLRGVVRVVDCGRAFGFVVDHGSLAQAVRTGALALPPEVAVSLERGEGTALAAASEPHADVVIAPGLALRFSLHDPGALAVRTRHERMLLAAALGGAGVVLVAVLVFLFVRMRRLRRTSELRTDFVAAVSHELRTPIASVRMLAELLEEGRVADDERAEVHGALARETRRLSDTVERVLHLRRLFAGKHTPDKRESDVRALVAARIDAFEAQHPEAAPVERTLEPVTALLDPAMLALVLDNLLANAHKHAPDGKPYGVTLGVRAGALELAVRDRGPGIAKRDQARIFAPFERADERLSRATEGFGIGLALVRYAADAHGGDVRVVSEPGNGACFTLRLPLGRGARTAEAA